MKDNHHAPKLFGVPRVLWLLASFIVIFVIAIQTIPKQRPFVNPKIVSKPYVWPLGCEKKRYKRSDKIGEECLVPRYYIGDGQEWGWHRTTKRPHYYRVGNDAVLVTNVILGEPLSKQQNIYNVVYDVFVTESGGLIDERTPALK